MSLSGIRSKRNNQVITEKKRVKGSFALLAAWVAALVVVFPRTLPAAETSGVKVWEENIVIPTYPAGAPEPNPIFDLGRNSQGAQGIVYPYPLYDILLHEKVDKTYKIVYLENEYIRIGVLPEIGGRLFEGIDKTNNYNFIYRQHVIKPALIGLIGAWISGGIEWNIPHHHRASTFLPVQYSVEENADGSKTVWVGELEVRHRMRWAVGYTVRPGKSYLEARVRILNRTPVANTMLCFANVAVHVNDDYQVMFPPSTQHGTFHGKREFVDWPVATTVYAGEDFTKGVDVSWYKNHLQANSIFAWNYSDDFFAGYDHGKHAGTMAVADHNIVPGKKVWTWGDGPRGRMWDHILTDNDGAYNELMVGAYSDNQPDYSWLQPYDVKSFSMNWYPFRELAGVKKANLDAAVNLDVKDGTAKVGFNTTSAFPAATVRLQAGSSMLLEETIAIDPGKPFVKQVAIPAGIDQHELRASISANGRELVSYSPVRLTPEPTPKPVTSPPPPADVKTIEELYLIGLRAEQFHDPAIKPEPYWEEALRRDPGDARVNTALGINYFKKARFAEAEQLFRKAMARLTDNYTTPKDAEPIYYLGLTLKAEGKFDEAFKYLYLATWNLQWRAAGYYGIAEIATMRGDYAAALDFIERSIDHNALNIRALNLKAAVLRHLGRPEEALQVLATAHRRTDPLDVRSMAERWLAGKSAESEQVLTAAMNDHPATASETAAEYLNAGLWQDGSDVLLQSMEGAKDKACIQPLVYYYLGYFAERMQQPGKAAEYYSLASKMPSEYVFPFQYEAIEVLHHAMTANPKDARAPYYLGNLLFDWQPAQAVRLWEASAAIDPKIPIVHRNLAIAYAYGKPTASLAKAIAHLETAVSLTPKYARHFAELDELYESAGAAPEKRLAILEKNRSVVEHRDDSTAREIGLLISLGKYDEAIARLTKRQFAVWEGANLNVADNWIDAHILRGRKFLAAKRNQEALADFKAALQVPSNLPSEGLDVAARGPEANYWIANSYEAMGDSAQARAYWQKAAAVEPGPARRGRRRATGLTTRDLQAYYQALALRRLGQTEKANKLMQGLVDAANESLQKAPAMNGTLEERRRERARLAAAHYAAGLGYSGLEDKPKAKAELGKALEASPDHAGAKSALESLD
jgi:tetratricopeptide (TPR) repeat protein